MDLPNSEKFSHEELRRRTMNVINGVEDPALEMGQRNFKISRNGQIHTVYGIKKFQIQLNKGILLTHGQLVPFGYSGERNDPRNNEYYAESIEKEEHKYNLAKILDHRFHPARPYDHFIFDSHLFYGRILRKIFHYQPNQSD